MKEAQVRGLFVLAEIDVLSLYEIENDYWPIDERYRKIRTDNPWWLVRIAEGVIKIGWRKRVISINWSDTSIRGVVTTHDVTKDDTMVHAWSYAAAVEYLTALRRLVDASRYVREREGDMRNVADQLSGKGEQ